MTASVTRTARWAPQGAPVDYTLGLDLTADQFGNTFQTVEDIGVVPPGDTVTLDGFVGEWDTVDGSRFTFEETGFASLTVDGLSPTGSLVLYTEDQTPVATLTAQNNTITDSAAVPGTYFMGVFDSSAGGSDYSITLTVPDEGTVNTDFDGTYDLQLTGTVMAPSIGTADVNDFVPSSLDTIVIEDGRLVGIDPLIPSGVGGIDADGTVDFGASGVASGCDFDIDLEGQFTQNGGVAEGSGTWTISVLSVGGNGSGTWQVTRTSTASEPSSAAANSAENDFALIDAVLSDPDLSLLDSV